MTVGIVTLAGIVVPAFNEANTIVAVVEKAMQFGTVIVVDDGSTDDTAVKALGAGAIVVSHHGNRGYDCALESGFARAADLDCEFVITMDADGQHNPQLLTLFVDELKNGLADVVIGVRNRRQRLAEHLFALVSTVVWGIRDPLCGMKAYRMHVYRSRGHFDSYGSIGTELAIYAARKGYRISQIPFVTRERIDQPRFDRAIRANWRIFIAMIKGFSRAK